MVAGILHLSNGARFFPDLPLFLTPVSTYPPPPVNRDTCHILTQAQNLAGFNGGPMAGCLCSRPSLDNVVGNVESNSLAKAAGITRSKIIDL